MRYECIIPIMKAQDSKITEKFGALGKILPKVNESFDDIKDFFEYAILDIFPERLSKDNPRIKLLDCEYFRLSAERNYLEFAKRLFRENAGLCYWYTEEFKFAQMQSYLYKIKLMDRIDEMIYLRQFEISEGNVLFRIEDLEILEFAIKYFLRELIGGTLFFEKRPLMILYNYDLLLPLLIETPEDKAHYKEIARSCGLYFR